MSRRAPNPAAERAAQNQQTLKGLLKLEPNKVCADCKRNKHPRWASWNLGIFICIRCSGIHRSMGTHISRVKSVDLDSWTDEQMHSIMSWGNARANKYWEAKLAPGHVPSESKIENFIRTKYELKRWVMDGPIPDPATLNTDGDDDIPLSLVKEKQTIERKVSVHKSPGGKIPAPRGHPQTAASTAAAAAPAMPVIDLFGDDSSAPSRTSSAGPQVPPKSSPAPPKTTGNTKDSLLGLDFLGSQPSAPARPSSMIGSSGGAQSRPDLKQSILSLYATAPRTQQAAQPTAQQGGGFGGLGSPTLLQTSTGSGGNNAGFVDAFSSLSFNNTAPAATSSKPVDAFAGLSFSSSSTTRQAVPAAAPTASSGFGGLGGGSFFDSKPTAPPAPAPVQANPPSSSSFGGLGGFGDFATPAPAAAAVPTPASSSNFGDLFDFSPAPTTTTTAIAPQPTATSPPPGTSASTNSVFNLSSPAKAVPTTAASPLASVTANWANSDVWGNEGWGATETAAAPAPAPTLAATPSASTSAIKSPGLASTSATNDFGWGSSGGSFATQSIVPGAGGGFNPQPKVAEDEEFGGWSSSTATANTSSGNGNTKPAAGGFGGANEDLFSNVWG